MSTQILDPRKDTALQPAAALWKRYQPGNAPRRFQATSPSEARDWQAATRLALSQQVGFQDLTQVDLQPQVLESVDRGDHIRHKILLRSSIDIHMPVYLLLPKEATPPYPVVLAFHGHGYGVKDIVGLWETARSA
jgi:hypothetical protein